MLVHRRVDPAVCRQYPFYTTGWRETMWGKVSCLRQQHDGRDWPSNLWCLDLKFNQPPTTTPSRPQDFEYAIVITRIPFHSRTQSLAAHKFWLNSWDLLFKFPCSDVSISFIYSFVLITTLDASKHQFVFGNIFALLVGISIYLQKRPTLTSSPSPRWRSKSSRKLCHLLLPGYKMLIFLYQSHF